MCLLPSSDGKRIKALLDTGKCLLKPHESSAEVPQGCLVKKKKGQSSKRDRKGLGRRRERTHFIMVEERQRVRMTLQRKSIKGGEV